MNVERLLQYCLEQLVDKPDVLTIKQSVVDGKTTFEVTVDASDRPRVIGREGKTFKALRALMNIPFENNPNDLVVQTAN